jgi:aspartyl protease family protein
MSGDQIASLMFLGLLGGAIALSYVASNRGNLGRVTRQAAIWVLIFLGAIAAVGLWPTIQDTLLPRQSVAQGGEIVVPMSADGHYYLTLEVNGTPLRFVVDTGASEIVLTTEDAMRIGIDPESLIYSGRAMTANGMVETAPVRLASVALGGVVDEAVRAVVNRGDLFESLLGMSYLRRFERLEITGGQLRLAR